jgi:hypothetical protein
MQTPGLAPLFATHSASAPHLRHLFAAASQMGLVGSAEQWALVVHSTHAPAGPHAGVVGLLVAQAFACTWPHATHLLFEQNGRLTSAVHWASTVHSTHAPVVGLHTGAAALFIAQAFVTAWPQPTHLLFEQNARFGSPAH